jgi:outer membrane protein
MSARPTGLSAATAAIIGMILVTGPSWAQTSSSPAKSTSTEPPAASVALAAPKLNLTLTSTAPYEQNWRDVFTPLADPLHTRPSKLDGDLSLQLPPELVHGLTKPGDLAGDVASRRTLALPCADATQASDLGNPQQALNALQSSQQPSRPLLTLPEAVQLALCHNPQVRASWSQIAQQAAALGQARSAYLPQLMAGMSRQRDRLDYPNTPYPESTLFASSPNLSLSWRLWDFGARSARTEVARWQLQAALASQDATMVKALGDVLQTYFDAQTAQARWQAQQSIVPLVQRSLQAAQRKQEHGAGSSNDTLQALTTVAQANLELSRSEGDYQKALANLTFALGLPPGSIYRLDAMDTTEDSRDGWAPRQQPQAASSAHSRSRTDPGPPQQRDETHRLMQKTLADWMAQVQQKHPAIVAARAQWMAAKAAVRAAQTDGLPTLDASYSYYRNGRPNQSLPGQASNEWLLGLTLTIPLFDGFNTTYKVRNAQAVAEQKAVEYQGIQQQTLQDIVQGYADAQAAWSNLHAAEQLRRAAQEAADSTQRQYGKGAADVVQVNQSLATLQQALQERARAQAEWLHAKLKLWVIDAQLGT